MKRKNTINQKLVFSVILWLFIAPIFSTAINVSADADTPYGPNIIDVWRSHAHPNQFDIVTVFVDANSTDGISSVSLLYDVNGITTVVPMKYIIAYWSQGAVYWGAIPKKDVGTVVSYVVELYDGGEYNASTTSLRYYYRVAEDGEPRIDTNNENPSFVTYDQITSISFNYSIYDADDINLINGGEVDIHLSYRINYGDIATASKSPTFHEEQDMVNCIFEIPSPESLGVSIDDIIYYWVNATDEHGQTGYTRVEEIQIIGNEPFVNNVYLSPSVPTTEDGVTIYAEIFYKESILSIDTYSRCYINSILHHSVEILEINNQYLFEGYVAPTHQRGTIELQLEIIYDSDGDGQTDTTLVKEYLFSVFDDIPSSIVSNHLLFTNAETELKYNEIDTANIEAYVYDNIRTYHVTAWFEDNYGTHGVSLLRDDTDYLNYIGEYGDDGISFCENMEYDNELLYDSTFDGLYLEQNYISWVKWDNTGTTDSYFEVTFDNTSITYIGIDLKDYVNFELYNNFAFTWKAVTQNTIIFTGVKDSIGGNYAWTGNEVISKNSFNTINVNNLNLTNSNIQNTKKIWLEFTCYSGQFDSDTLIIDKIRLQKEGHSTDNDYAVYHGNYLPVGQDTSIDCYLSLTDYRQTIYTSKVSEYGNPLLTVVDGLPPTLSVNDVYGIDFTDEYIPIGCLVTDDSEINTPLLYHRYFDDDEIIDPEKPFSATPISMIEITTSEFYYYLYPDNLSSSFTEFNYNMTIEFYITVSDIFDNNIQSSINSVFVSETVLPTFIVNETATTINIDTQVELQVDVVSDEHSGIKSVSICWTNPLNTSQSAMWEGEENVLLLEPTINNNYSLIINGSELYVAGYLYWYAIIEDGEGNKITSSVRTIIIQDITPPEYDTDSFTVLNYEPDNIHARYNQDIEIGITVRDHSMIQSISLVGTIIDSTPKDYPGMIDWDRYWHEGNTYNYTFVISRPSSDNYWSPENIMTFKLVIVDVYGEVSEIIYQDEPSLLITLVDGDKPLISGEVDVKIVSPPTFTATISFNITDRSDVEGYVYYGIYNSMLLEPWTNSYSWDLKYFCSYDANPTFLTSTEPLGELTVYHFDVTLDFDTNEIDIGNVIDYYIYFMDEYWNLQIDSRSGATLPTKIAGDYGANTFDVGVIEHFESRQALLIEDFSEYPYDDVSLIYSDGVPEVEGNWSEGLEGYGVDLWDEDYPYCDDIWNPAKAHFYDLLYTPYRISTNDYGPQVGRHTSAIYAYDFDVSNTKTMYTLNVTKLELDKNKHVHDVVNQAEIENWDTTMCELWTLSPLRYGGRDASGNDLYGNYDLGNYLIKQPLNEFLMSKKPYSGFNVNTPGEEWDDTATAINGNLRINHTYVDLTGTVGYHQDTDGYNYDSTDLPYSEQCIKVRIPLSFSKAMPFFKIMFSEVTNCEIDVLALNYYAWTRPNYVNWVYDTYGEPLYPTDYEYDSDAVWSFLINDIDSNGTYYSSLSRPEEFWGIELRIYPTSSVFSTTIDFLKLYQIRYDFSGEDLSECCSTTDYIPMAYEYIDNYYYNDFETQNNMTTNYFDTIGEGKFCIAATHDYNKNDGTWESEYWNDFHIYPYYFSVADSFYVKDGRLKTFKMGQNSKDDRSNYYWINSSYNAPNPSIFDDINSNPIFLEEYHKIYTTLLLPDFPLFDSFNGKSFLHMAQDIIIDANNTYMISVGDGNSEGFNVISPNDLMSWTTQHSPYTIENAIGQNNINHFQTNFPSDGGNTIPWFGIELGVNTFFDDDYWYYDPNNYSYIESISFSYTLGYLVDEFIHYMAPTSRWYGSSSQRVLTTVQSTTDEPIFFSTENYYLVLDLKDNDTTTVTFHFSPILGTDYRMTDWDPEYLCETDDTVKGYGEYFNYWNGIFENTTPNYQDYIRYSYIDLNYDVFKPGADVHETSITTSWMNETLHTFGEIGTLSFPEYVHRIHSITDYDLSIDPAFNTELTLTASLDVIIGGWRDTCSFEIRSFGEQWISKETIVIAEEYLFVNSPFDRYRRYKIDHSPDSSNLDTATLTYDKYSSLLPSSYLDKLTIESRIVQFNDYVQPDTVLIKSVAIYDIFDNEYVIYSYSTPYYFVDEYYRTLEFSIKDILPESIFCFKKLIVTYESNCNTTTSYWLEIDDVEFIFRNDYDPESKFMIDIYGPELQDPTLTNFISTTNSPDTFTFSGTLYDFTGVDQAEFYYMRDWTNWDDWYDTLEGSNHGSAMIQYGDTDWISLGTIVNQTSFSFSNIPSVDAPYTISRIFFKIIALDTLGNGINQEIIEFYWVEDVEEPLIAEIETHTEYNYDTQNIDFQVNLKDWSGIDETIGVGLWVYVAYGTETEPSTSYYLPMNKVSGNEYNSIYEVLVTNTDVNWYTDGFLTYHYVYFDIYGNMGTIGNVTVDLIDGVDPYVYSNDINHINPSTINTGYSFDVILRARDEFSNPVTIQMSYYVYDESAGTTSYQSGTINMVYDSYWNIIEGVTYRGFVYTINPTECGGYEYIDEICVTFYVRDAEGNVLTLDGYYIMLVGDTIAPVYACINLPNGLGNDHNYAVQVNSEDNLGGSGIERAYIYYSQDNITWYDHQMSFDQELGGISFFSSDIAQSYLDAGLDLYYYTVVYDDENNAYTSDISFYDIPDKIAPSISSTNLKPSKAWDWKDVSLGWDGVGMTKTVESGYIHLVSGGGTWKRVEVDMQSYPFSTDYYSQLTFRYRIPQKISDSINQIRLLFYIEPFGATSDSYYFNINDDGNWHTVTTTLNTDKTYCYIRLYIMNATHASTPYSMNGDTIDIDFFEILPNVSNDDIGYLDNGYINTIITTHGENPSLVRYVYNVNWGGTITLTMTLNNETGKYEVIIPQYNYEDVINGEIRATSSGGTINTFNLDFTIVDNVKPIITINSISVFKESYDGTISIIIDEIEPIVNYLITDGVAVRHRLQGTTPWTYADYPESPGTHFTATIPGGTYVTDDVIEVGISVSDNNGNFDDKIIYITVMENVAPTVQSVNAPDSAWDVTIPVEITLSDLTGVDANTVQFKHKTPSGAWTSYVTMSTSDNVVFSSTINANDHADVYSINCYVIFSDTLGNQGSHTFYVESLDLYAPNQPTLNNPPDYVDINNNAEDTSVTIKVSSIDNGPTGDYYCSSGEYRYKEISDYATNYLNDPWDFDEDLDGWDSSFYSSRSSTGGNLELTVDSSGTRYYYGVYNYLTSPIDMLNSGYNLFKIKVKITELPIGATACRLSVGIASNPSNFWASDTWRYSGWTITQINTWYEFEYYFDSFHADTDATDINLLRIQLQSNDVSKYFSPNSAKFMVDDIRLINENSIGWSSWQNLSFYSDNELAFILQDFDEIYLGDTINYEVKMYDNSNNPSAVTSGTLAIDDHYAPGISSYYIVDDYGDNGDLPVSATIISTGYDILAVSFDYYTTDPNSRTYLTVTQNGNYFSATIPNSAMNLGDTIHCRWTASDTRPISSNFNHVTQVVEIIFDETGPEVVSLSHNGGTDNIIQYDETLEVYVTISDSSEIDEIASAKIYIKPHYSSTWVYIGWMTQHAFLYDNFDMTLPSSAFTWQPNGDAYRWYDIKIEAKDSNYNWATHIVENFFKIDDYKDPIYQTYSISDSTIYEDETFWLYFDFVDSEESMGSSGMDHVQLKYQTKAEGESTWSAWTYYSGYMDVEDSNTWKKCVGAWTSLGGGQVKFQAKGWDKANNYVFSSTVTVDIIGFDTTPPSVTSYSHTPGGPEAGTSATVYAYVSEPDSPLTVEVEWYISGQSHHTNTMIHGSGDYYHYDSVMASVQSDVRTYYRIIATSDGGTTTTTYKYFTSQGGFQWLLKEQRLLDWSFDKITHEFSTSFELPVIDYYVMLNIKESTGEYRQYPLLSNTQELDKASAIIDLLYKEEIEFYVSVFNDYHRIYSSDVYNYEIGDIYYPEILEVNLPQLVNVSDQVEVNVLINEKNVQSVLLEFLREDDNKELEVYKDKEMYSDNSFYTTNFKAKDFPGYCLRIKVSDTSGHGTVSKIYYLYTLNNGTNDNTIILPIVIVSISVSVLALIIFRSKLRLGRNLSLNFTLNKFFPRRIIK